MLSTRLAASKWIRNYTKAWREKNAKAIASLFSEDATYHSHPFRAVRQGRKSVLEYTLGALDVGEVYEVRFGKPIVEGSRVAVEYWATMKEKVDDVTLAGCVMLNFAKSGLCKELRDYWVLQTGRQPAPAYIGPVKTVPKKIGNKGAIT